MIEWFLALSPVMQALIGTCFTWFLTALGASVVFFFKSINRIPFKINPFPYDRFPNIKRIANVSCPLLVIHGDQDMVIDQSHGKAVYEKHPGKKVFHNAKGLGHNDTLSDKAVNAALFDFLKM